MPVSQLPQAPYRQDRKVFLTPIIGDVLFSEVRDCNRGKDPFPEYGTPHPNKNKYPDHKLVFIKPVDIERNDIFEFFYAADRKNQDLYNFSSGNQNLIGNVSGREFRIVQRSYVTPRDEFVATDIPFGTPMANVPEGAFGDVEYVFFDKKQQRIEPQELDSLYVAEVHTYVEKTFLEDKVSIAVQRPDPLPEKFQIVVPELSVSEIVEGKVEQPSLSGSQLAIKQDQLNPDVKLVQTTSRDRTNLPVSLEQKATTNEKQVATITETVQEGDTAESPTSTVDIESQAIGDGTYVVRKTEVPELFTADSFSTEKPDLVPAKFRSQIPTTTEESNEEGTAEAPVLGDDELAVTEQQVNKFVKRKRKVKRDIVKTPVSLTQKATLPTKQVATITETLQKGDTSEQPSATVDIESESLGDGNYLVRKVEAPELFTQKAFSVQKTDVIPEKFRDQVPVTQTSQLIEGEAEAPALSGGQIQASREQVNEFVYREEITERPEISELTLPNVERSYVEGAVAEVEEKVVTSNTPPVAETGPKIVSSEVTSLGDNKYLVQTVRVREYPKLVGSQWDNDLNAPVRRTQQFVAPPENVNKPYTSYEPINEYKSLEITETPPTEALRDYLMTLPIRIDVPLPDVLKSISVVWSEDKGQGDFATDWSGSAGGSSYSLSGSDSGSAESSGGLKPNLTYDIERPWSSKVSAKIHFFFLPFRIYGSVGDINGVYKGNDTITEVAILDRLTTVYGSRVTPWKIFKPVSHTLVLTGGSAQVQAKAQWSAAVQQSEGTFMNERTEGGGTGISIGQSISTVTLPPTIHPDLVVGSSGSRTLPITAKAEASVIGTNFPTIRINKTKSHTIKGSVYPEQLPATDPPAYPTTGYYLMQTEITPYKWGWARCSAVVLDAGELGTLSP